MTTLVGDIRALKLAMGKTYGEIRNPLVLNRVQYDRFFSKSKDEELLRSAFRNARVKL